MTDERTVIPMNPVADMLLTNPAPAAIWATLWLLCLPALILLASPNGLRHPRLTMRQTIGLLRRRGDVRRRLRDEAIENVRYADEMRVAADQATSAGHSTQAELHLLCTHGILHLLGYDHGEPDDEQQMFDLQAQLLADWSSASGVGPIRTPLAGTAAEGRNG